MDAENVYIVALTKLASSSQILQVPRQREFDPCSRALQDSGREHTYIRFDHQRRQSGAEGEEMISTIVGFAYESLQAWHFHGMLVEVHPSSSSADIMIFPPFDMAAGNKAMRKHTHSIFEDLIVGPLRRESASAGGRDVVTSSFVTYVNDHSARQSECAYEQAAPEQ